LAIYDGVVTLADDDIPVIVELEDDHIRMSAAGTEIGQWPADECLITLVGETTYSITAEDETLEFVPNQPSLFAAAVNAATDAGPAVAMPPPPDAKPLPSDGVREAPAPKPLTMGLFYALCLITAALGLWSLISIVL
jgi:hypothetical protein